MTDADSSPPKAHGPQSESRASEAPKNKIPEAKNGSSLSETTTAEAVSPDEAGMNRNSTRKGRNGTQLRNKKRKTKRLRKTNGTNTAFSEDLQQLREVFVSFCKPASLMSPDFDVKTVASDPLQLDTIKMNSANFAKFSRDCCMVSVTGEGLSLSRTDVDIIFARQMAKATDRRNISWLQFLECLSPMAEKLDFSFEEFCSAVVQQSRHQIVMKNAVAQRKRQQAVPIKNSRYGRGRSKKYTNKVLQPKSRRLSVVERKEELRTEWVEMAKEQRTRLQQSFRSFCHFAPNRQVLDDSSERKMTGTAWAKFCRDCKFLGPKLTVQDVDILFAKNKSKGKRKITWIQFFQCCVELSVQMDMHVDQFLRAVNMPSLNHITHFDDNFLYGKEALVNKVQPVKATTPGLFKAKPASSEQPTSLGMSDSSDDDPFSPFPETPQPAPLDYLLNIANDIRSPQSDDELDDQLTLQDEDKEVDTKELLKSLMLVAEDDGMLSAQEKQWVAGYRDFVEADPSQLSEEDSAVPIAIQFPRHSASLQYLDENTVMSPIERVQQIKDLWSKTHAAVIAQREQYSPSKSPRTTSPKATKKAYTDERTPEFKEAIELARESIHEMDEVAASLLLECWGDESERDLDASVVDSGSSTPAKDLQELAATMLSP